MNKQAQLRTSPAGPTNRWEARHWVAAFVTCVNCSLLFLSLSHLAHGLEALTGDSRTLSIALAVGIDLGVIASELALVVSQLRRIRGVKGHASAVLVVTLLLSGILNALSYTSSKVLWTFEWWLCSILGAFIPVTVYCLSKVAAALVVGAEDAKGEGITTLEEAQEAENAAARYRRAAKKAQA